MKPIKYEQAIGKSTAENGCLEEKIRNESHIYKIGMELLDGKFSVSFKRKFKEKGKETTASENQ